MVSLHDYNNFSPPFFKLRPRSDNDQYTHINNSIYYHLFDSIINTYLIEKCGQDPARSELIGLVVSSHCEVCMPSGVTFPMKLTKPSVQFFSPLSFPEVLELGLRVNKLGSSSAVYEVGIFKSGEEVPAAVGGYTHVFVQRNSRKSTQMLEGTRLGLAKLLNTAAKL